jgi:hypothetical protein
VEETYTILSPALPLQGREKRGGVTVHEPAEMRDIHALLAVLRETRALLALPGNDFTWSSWDDQVAALREIDAHIAALERGVVPRMAVLYAPTGPLQEVSLSSGWGDRFLALATRFEQAWSRR